MKIKDFQIPNSLSEARAMLQKLGADGLPVAQSLRQVFDTARDLMQQGKVAAAASTSGSIPGT